MTVTVRRYPNQLWDNQKLSFNKLERLTHLFENTLLIQKRPLDTGARGKVFYLSLSSHFHPELDEGGSFLVSLSG